VRVQQMWKPLRRHMEPRRRSNWLSELVALLFAALVGTLAFFGVFERPELWTHDQRFALRPPRPTSARIVLAKVTDTTLKTWNEPMVFWGTHYADLIRQARKAGVAWIGLDFVPAFSADTYLEALGVAPRPDRDFQQALVDARRRVVFSNVLPAEGDSAPLDPIPQIMTLDEVQGRVGFINLLPAPDGVVRMAALFVRDGAGTLWPSFPALLAACACGITSPVDGDAALLTDLAGSTTRNRGVDGFYINYTGRAWPAVSAERLASGRLSASDRSALRGAVLLVGASYSGSGDEHPGPAGTAYSGIQVHGHAIATLLDGRALRRWAARWEALVSMALALVAAGIGLLPLGRGAALVLTLAGVWCASSVALFQTHDLLLPTVGPLLGLLLPWSACHAVRSLEEGYRRLQAENARLQVEAEFGRFLSPQIRDYLLRAPGHRRLGGAPCDVSVLFFDIRNSLSRAEDRDPARMLDELNDFFHVVIPVLDDNGGVLYRYTGDGFLAVFGAPFELPGHAQAAVATAWQIVGAVRQYNETAAATGRQEQDPWRVGCGIHSGPVVYGNLGVANRSEFTVIGDTVNLAARLEGLNKKLGSEIVLSGETYTRLSQRPPVCGPQACPIEGRKRPVDVYWLPFIEDRAGDGDSGDPDHEMCEATCVPETVSADNSTGPRDLPPRTGRSPAPAGRTTT